MKKYQSFILERISTEKKKYTDIIINYLKKKSNLDLYEYAEEFIINKEGEPELNGKLYLIPNNKAVRFNFDSQKLYSVDIWDEFVFKIVDKLCNKPTYTMYINTTVMEVLDDILKFVSGVSKITEEIEDISTEEEGFKNIEKKEEENIEPSDKIEIKKSPTEDVQLQSLKISKNVIDLNIDVFEAISMYTAQVAYKASNGLIVSGAAGLGKTSEVTNTLNEMRIDYVSFSGDISTAGLYETLFLNKKKLLLFDDCDAVFKDENSVNLLKKALDTYKRREVSRTIKTHFDSEGMTDFEMKKEYDATGKLPKKFFFEGQAIFITNIDGKDIDPALISRCLHVDVQLSRSEVLLRMKKIMNKIMPNVNSIVKEETLEFLDYIISHFPSKFPLNIRTLVHSLNIRISNEYEKEIDGKFVPVWQMLIKQYLIKKN